MKTSSIIRKTVMVILILALLISSSGCSCAPSAGPGEDAASEANAPEGTQDEGAGEGSVLYETKNETASFELDQDKTLMLDKGTRVELLQKAKDMTIHLSAGEILLDVRKKLVKDETLTIQTSGMNIDIRGTIVFVKDVPEAGAGDTGARATTLGVLEGTTQVTYVDREGTPTSLTLGAGELLRLISKEGKVETPAEAQPITQADIAGFVAEQIRQVPDLERRTGLEEPQEGEVDPYQAGGDWTYNGTVTLVAQSASKLYDGTPLTRSGSVLVSGLPEGFTIQAYASGSQTDAGQEANSISSYKIFNKMGEDVTSHFTNIQTVDGVLLVDPAPLSVWTASSWKVYDGTPLTNPNAGFRTTLDYNKDLPAWQNTAMASTGLDGSQILYGISGTVHVHGSNPLTGEARDLDLKAGQRLTIWFGSGDDSIEFRVDDLSEEELPEQVLRLYQQNPGLLAKAIDETGWDEGIIAGLISKLSGSAEGSVSKEGLTVDKSEAGNLFFDSTYAYVTVDSELTDYEDRALGGDEVRFRSLGVEQSIKVTATGSQTSVGESVNTYTIDWGNANPNNYILTENLGTLTVAARETNMPVTREVTFTAGSGSKVFDGTALTSAEVTVTGLPEGYTYSATCSGSQTDVGTGSNTIASYQIRTPDGTDVTSLFTNVKTKAGTLTVEPLEIAIAWDQSRVVTYDGTARNSEAGLVSATYVNGPYAGEEEEQFFVSTGVDAKTYQFDLFTGDQITVTPGGGGKDAGTYEITLTGGVKKGSAANYEISFGKGTLEIAPVELIVVTDSASKEFDGQPLKAGIAVYRMADGKREKISGTDGKVTAVKDETITFTASGSQTQIGNSKNTYTAYWGSVNKKNYSLTEELGTLLVTEKPEEQAITPEEPVQEDKVITAAITITAGSANKVYDGTPLTNTASTAAGLPQEYTYTAICTGSQTDVGTSTNVVSSYQIFDGNGKNVTEFANNVVIANGTLTVSPLQIKIQWTQGKAITYQGFYVNAGAYESVTSFTYLNGPHAGETVTDEILEPVVDEDTSVSYDFALYNGDKIRVGLSGGGKNVGTYDITIATEMITGKASNYSITTASEPLKILPIELLVKTESAEKFKDGSPLSAAGIEIFMVTENGDLPYTLEGGSVAFIYGETISIAANGTISDIGEADNTYTINWGSVDKNNYHITDELGTLKIYEYILEIETGSRSKYYDKAPLTCSVCTLTLRTQDASYDPSSSNVAIKEIFDQIEIEATGTITEPGETVNTYSIDWGNLDPSSFKIVERLGTLTIKCSILEEYGGKVDLRQGRVWFRYSQGDQTSYKFFDFTAMEDYCESFIQNHLSESYESYVDRLILDLVSQGIIASS